MSASATLNTLLIGGAGFVGQALMQVLSTDSRRQITVLGRSSRPQQSLPAGVRYVQGDAGNTTLLAQLMQNMDDVVDLAYATVPQTSFIDPLFDVVANLPTAVHALQLASKATLRRYVLVSSGGTVYGNTQVERIHESHPTNPVSPYGISKLVTEKYALFFHQMDQLPVIIARPGNPFGVQQVGQTAQGFVGAAIAAIRVQRPITVYGPRGTVRDYLHVDDLARGLAALLEYGQTGSIYNLGSGLGNDNLQVLDLLQDLARSDGLSVQCIHQAARPFDVQRNVLDSSLALQHCGWQPRLQLTEGLQQVWQASRTLIPGTPRIYL